MISREEKIDSERERERKGEKKNVGEEMRDTRRRDARRPRGKARHWSDLLNDLWCVHRGGFTAVQLVGSSDPTKGPYRRIWREPTSARRREGGGRGGGAVEQRKEGEESREGVREDIH